MFLLNKQYNKYNKSPKANLFDPQLSLIERIRCDLKNVIENSGIKVNRINICLKDACLDIKVEIDGFTSNFHHL